MALQKITFDGSSVTSKRDADINHHLGGLVPAGIISGLGSECSVSVSNNYIKFKEGYVQIYGRRIYVEEGSQVYVSLDGTKYGYVIIEVNLSTNSVALKSVETTSTSYPSLTKENLMATGTIYQFPLAKYKKTTTSITLQSFTPTFITCGLREVHLVKKSQTQYFEDPINYEEVREVTFDISDVPYDAIVYITFTVVDTLGYGGFGQHCGTITIPNSDIYWTTSYHQVRSSQNSGNTGTVTFIISSNDFGVLRIQKSGTSSYFPNCVEVSYYVIEGE